ncbi:MAG: hypothetical protein LBI26_02155, partial [Holosporales bacterium]|nr:hypothetical protein [Holosporales bacterium]
MNKILLATGVFAAVAGGVFTMACDAGAVCQVKNGIYGAIGVGYGVTTIKDDITTAAGKISYKAKTTTIASEASTADIKADLDDASKAKLTAYQTALRGFEEKVVRLFATVLPSEADGLAVGAGNITGISWANAAGMGTNASVYIASAAGPELAAVAYGGILADAILQGRPAGVMVFGADASASQTVKELIYRTAKLIEKSLGEGYKIVVVNAAGAVQEMDHNNRINIAAAAAVGSVTEAIYLRLPDGTKEEIVPAATRFGTTVAGAPTAATRYNEFMKYLNTMVTGTHKALAKHALGTADLKSVGTSTVQEAGKL